MTSEIDVRPVPAADRSVLGNLMQFYRYDFSELRGEDVTAHGLFGYPYLDHYFTEAGREACFITVDGAPAGFSMTRELGGDIREMSEFFVLRRHRRRGVGEAAAGRVLRRHPGAWSLAFDHANGPAARFWPRVVAGLAAGPVHRRDRRPPEVAHPGTVLRFRVP